MKIWDKIGTPCDSSANNEHLPAIVFHSSHNLRYSGSIHDDKFESAPNYVIIGNRHINTQNSKKESNRRKNSADSGPARRGLYSTKSTNILHYHVSSKTGNAGLTRIASNETLVHIKKTQNL